MAAFSGQTVGIFLNTAKAYNGYTLLAPKHNTNVYLINNAGQIVGYSALATSGTHAFLYSGSMTDLGTLGGTAYSLTLSNGGLKIVYDGLLYRGFRTRRPPAIRAAASRLPRPAPEAHGAD